MPWSDMSAFVTLSSLKEELLVYNVKCSILKVVLDSWTTTNTFLVLFESSINVISGADVVHTYIVLPYACT